jgi:GH15 family glucan-1,4-alpha-glucosidase
VPGSQSGIPPIKDYGFIGDTRTGALVSSNGSIDWMCWPQFDSEPVFGRLIDSERGGAYELSVAGAKVVWRRYNTASAVLVTQWTTPFGEARLTEAMAMSTRMPAVIRVLECTRGQVDVRLRYAPRPGLPGRRTSVPFTLHTAPSLELSKSGAWGGRLAAGERISTLVSEGRSPITHRTVADLLARTDGWWQRWSDGIRSGPAYRDVLVRSLINLRLLTYSPTGAPIAAPTTSLPEEIGGVRNWDYRFSWPRDASVGVAAFLAVSKHDEARGFVEWLTARAASTERGIRVLYTLDGTSGAPEHAVRRVSGYRNSRPVRVGNRAEEQHQLDVYGWVIDAIWNFVDAGHTLSRRSLSVLAQYADSVCAEWRLPDAGIWEIRDDSRHYVHSKVWAWIALDRAARIGHRLRMRHQKVVSWERARDELAADIRDKGFDSQLGAYVRAYGSDELDTALLLLPLTGFEKEGSERLTGTVDAIWKRLTAGDPLLYRYLPGRDGLPGKEGAFLPCTFWLLEALLRLGRHEDGLRLFEQVLGIAGDLLLLPEEIDPATREFLGNYPLALSQAGLVHAVLEVQRVLETSAPPAPGTRRSGPRERDPHRRRTAD